MKLKQTKHGYQAALFTWSWYSPGTSQDSWAIKAKRSHDSDRKGTWTEGNKQTHASYHEVEDQVCRTCLLSPDLATSFLEYT